MGKLTSVKAELGVSAKVDKYLAVVNQSPPADMVKDHPMARGVKYLPIEHVESTMDTIFQQWRVEVLREGQLMNSVYTAVRVHFLHPVTNEWTYQDGLGAVAVQTTKGAKASDLTEIVSDAVMKALPASKSYAIKDAVELIGNVFGRNLNRRDALPFESIYQEDGEKVIGAVRRIEAVTTENELRGVWNSLGNLITYEEVIKAKDAKKAELSA